jgi:membrane protease YdiL (CAAX protease family)
MLRSLGDVYQGRGDWLIVPIILAGPALLATLAFHRTFKSLGFHTNNMQYSLRLLGLVSLIFLPLTLAALWVLKETGWITPTPLFVKADAWAGWILFQFLYVATSEEIFFRGYLITRLERLFSADRFTLTAPFLCIFISASVFALAHVLLHGTFAAGLTFLPGLVLGWLFIKTRSLVAPVLFHGLANVFYALIQPMI